jgi:hypothetical protein
MWVLEAVFWVVLIVVTAILGLAGFLAISAAGVVRRLPVVRHIPAIGVPPRPRAGADADLFACPERLRELEARLAQRHDAVSEQLVLLRNRRAALAAKPSRADLARNYDADVALLERRAASMRRVLTQVWKTRSILLLRAQLAATARRRPDLGRLPDPDAGDLHIAARRFHEAADRVKGFLDRVDTDADRLEAVVPARPAAAEADESALEAVATERLLTRAAYGTLHEDVDRLVDNLIWLGDHCAARSMADGSPEPPDETGGAARLLDEVEVALRAVAQLSRSVDPVLAASALANLDEELGGLEKAGMEARAEADAVLEVDRLLRPLPA